MWEIRICRNRSDSYWPHGLDWKLVTDAFTNQPKQFPTKAAAKKYADLSFSHRMHRVTESTKKEK